MKREPPSTAESVGDGQGRPGPASYLVSVVRGRRGLIPGIIRLVLAAFALGYVAGLKFYLSLYRIGLRRAARLPCKVVCIGNLTAGGTGKTPTTQMVCRLLAAQGKRVAVIIRGYGGDYEHDCALVSDGDQVLLNARQAGDEAYLLARTLPGVPVAVGRDRIRTGSLVVRECRPDVIVMDDGMQHWRLHRDLDVVLLNACEPFDNGWTFPRGMLREPKTHIRRAGIVLLTNARRAGDGALDALRREVSALAPGRPIFVGDLEPVALLDAEGSESAELGWLDGRRVCAMSALGNPASFESMLGEQGAVLAANVRFRDHHQITRRDLDEVLRKSVLAGADAVITTEKDAVKLTAGAEALPLRVLRVAMVVSDEIAFASAIVDRLEPRDSASRVPTLKLS
jgi:tetraacyldisaccharide 4'-kinase